MAQHGLNNTSPAPSEELKYTPTERRVCGERGTSRSLTDSQANRPAQAQTPVTNPDGYKVATEPHEACQKLPAVTPGPQSPCRIEVNQQ